MNYLNYRRAYLIFFDRVQVNIFVSTCINEENRFLGKAVRWKNSIEIYVYIYIHLRVCLKEFQRKRSVLISQALFEDWNWNVCILFYIIEFQPDEPHFIWKINEIFRRVNQCELTNKKKTVASVSMFICETQKKRDRERDKEREENSNPLNSWLLKVKIW